MKTFIFAFISAAVLSLIAGKIVIPILKKKKIGQPILGYVKEHKSKSGTPTMGGLFFVLSATAVYFAFGGYKERLGIITSVVTLGFMAVGFTDDFLKVKGGKNEGLKPLKKFVFQFAVAIIASVYAYLSGLDFLYAPFTIKTITLGVWSIPLNVFVFLATVNGVNLTDGLDGLCGSVSLIALIAFSALIGIEIDLNSAFYASESAYLSVALSCVCLSGAICGFLCFNVSAASVFMGDTGSLATGGALATAAIISGNTLYIPVICVAFVASVLSVIIQVIHYKRTKKRVFLMAPLHHHFQHRGYSEAKISFCYAFVTAIISAAAIASVMR